MESTYLTHVSPVPKRPGIGIVLIGIIAALLILGVLIYIFSGGSYPPHKLKKIRVKVHNHTGQDTKIKFENQSGLRHLDFDRGAKTDISVRVGTTLESEFEKGGNVYYFTYRVLDPDIKELYLSPRGFKSDKVSSSGSTLYNISDIPIQFITKDHKGSGYIVVSVYPQSSGKGYGLDNTQVIEVMDPFTYEIYSSIRINNNKTRTLTFDGEKLS